MSESFFYLYKQFKREFNIALGEVRRRRILVLARGLGNLILTILGIWFAWLEFGGGLYQSKLFWILIIGWGYFNLFGFLENWANTSNHSIDEKIDLLIKEVRELKDDRNNKQT